VKASALALNNSGGVKYSLIKLPFVSAKQRGQKVRRREDEIRLLNVKRLQVGEVLDHALQHNLVVVQHRLFMRHLVKVDGAKDMAILCVNDVDPTYFLALRLAD